MIRRVALTMVVMFCFWQISTAYSQTPVPFASSTVINGAGQYLIYSYFATVVSQPNTVSQFRIQGVPGKPLQIHFVEVWCPAVGGTFTIMDGTTVALTVNIQAGVGYYSSFAPFPGISSTTGAFDVTAPACGPNNSSWVHIAFSP